MDHRPFWWIQETEIYGQGPRPHLRQTPLTCETGPGSPSGHMQGASSLMYVIVQHSIHTFIMSNKRMDESRKRRLEIALWTSYTLLMILVGISRLYTATHFPHQTLLGLVAGNVTYFKTAGMPQCYVMLCFRLMPYVHRSKSQKTVK
jgi:glucose-6-phosphatase